MARPVAGVAGLRGMRLLPPASRCRRRPAAAGVPLPPGHAHLMCISGAGGHWGARVLRARRRLRRRTHIRRAPVATTATVQSRRGGRSAPLAGLMCPDPHHAHGTCAPRRGGAVATLVRPPPVDRARQRRLARDTAHATRAAHRDRELARSPATWRSGPPSPALGCGGAPPRFL